MRLLVVASYNRQRFAPFVKEQVCALERAGVEVSWFGVSGKGLRGYLRELPRLKQFIRDYHPDIIHAHYGLCGLLASMQSRVPVVTTYHGSDINQRHVRPFSRVAMRRSAANIFVSRRLMRLSGHPRHALLLPCGVDENEWQGLSRTDARELMHLVPEKRYVLFAGAIDNEVKDAPLALSAVALYQQEHADEDVELVELKGYDRREVTLLMCAADCLLLTSKTEGSPQVVKEAMMCGCPIVSVDVGDVSERVSGVEGCYVVESRTPQDLADKLHEAFLFTGKTTGRQKIESDGLLNSQIAARLIDLYEDCWKIER